MALYVMNIVFCYTCVAKTCNISKFVSIFVAQYATK